MIYAGYLLFPAIVAAFGGNPDPDFDPTTSTGTLPPFAAPARVPATDAVGKNHRPLQHYGSRFLRTELSSSILVAGIWEFRNRFQCCLPASMNLS